MRETPAELPASLQQGAYSSTKDEGREVGSKIWPNVKADGNSP